MDNVLAYLKDSKVGNQTKRTKVQCVTLDSDALFVVTYIF